MTTGRINQVSILRVRSHTLEERSRLVTPHPRDGGDQDIYKVRGRPEPTPSPGDRRGRSHQGIPAGHPIAPTAFPKEWSGADVGIRDAERRPTLHHTPLSWRIPATDHIGPQPCSEAASKVATDIGFG